jgi:hypothetical protein
MKAMGKRLDLAVEVVEEKLDQDIGDAMSRAQVMRQEILGRIDRNVVRSEESRRLLVQMVLDTRERLAYIEGREDEETRRGGE